MPTLNIIGAGKLGRTLFDLTPKDLYQTALLARGDSIDAADITLLTVQDGKISALAKQIPTSGVLLHCSGALDHEVLRPHPTVATMHPLMTFPGPDIQTPEPSGITAAISGDSAAVEVATILAKAFGFTPFTFNGDRMLYHAAAVIAGNFTSHLYRVATNLLREAGMPDAIIQHALLPLTLQSATNAANFPDSALTGPAARGDEKIISAHIDALLRSENEQTADLYKSVTNDIITKIIAAPLDAQET
jgi:predicted short-subunit dehydrogenase-like oxidoreductase (DUF2520 family)